MKCRVCNKIAKRYFQKFISIPEDNNLYECSYCGCLNRIGPSPNVYKTGIYRNKKYMLDNHKFEIDIDLWAIENAIKKGLWLKKHFINNFKINKINWVLDVGGYTGLVGYIISKHFKVKCYLDEIDQKGPKIGKLLKKDLIIAKQKLKKPGLIIFAQVLEHISNPSLFLSKKLKNIDNDSYVYIEVPNSTNFPCVDPNHLVDFTKEGIILIAEKNNLKVIKHWNDGDPMSKFRWDNFQRKHCFLFKKVLKLKVKSNLSTMKSHTLRKKIAIIYNIPFWIKKMYLKQLILVFFDLIGFSKIILKLNILKFK